MRAGTPRIRHRGNEAKLNVPIVQHAMYYDESKGPSASGVHICSCRHSWPRKAEARHEAEGVWLGEIEQDPM